MLAARVAQLLKLYFCGIKLWLLNQTVIAGMSRLDGWVGISVTGPLMTLVRLRSQSRTCNNLGKCLYKGYDFHQRQRRVDSRMIWYRLVLLGV